MGQTIGSTPLAVPEVAHLANLPKKCVFDLWEAFNDVAEGFGLTLEEFQGILKGSVKDYLVFTEQRLSGFAEVLFRTFDDDKNDLIDALEFLASVAVVSGMSLEEKIRYVFGIYDFDESGVLSMDEAVLAMRSTISGLCKLSAIEPPPESELEAIALAAFDLNKRSGGQGSSAEDRSITVDEFLAYCLKTPEVTSWVEYYAAVPEVEVARPGYMDKSAEGFYRREGQPLVRTTLHAAAMDVDGGLKERLRLERHAREAPFAGQLPWQNVVPFTEPHGAPKVLPPSAPMARLILQWAYGFNPTCSRGSVHYTSKGEVLFPAGATAVMYDSESHAQRFYISHTDLIQCCTVHQMAEADNLGRPVTMVASGQMGMRPKVNVWRLETCAAVASFRGFHCRGISHLSFCGDGHLLLSVGMDPEHCVAVHHWATQSTIFAAPSTTLTVLGCCFVKAEFFVTCGWDHITFWDRFGPCYTKSEGIFGPKGFLQPMLCCAALDNRIISGSASGHLYVWEGRNCSRCLKAHTGAITAIAPGGSRCRDGFVTGSADGKVQVWTPALEMGACFDVRTLGGLGTVIHSLCWNTEARRILIANESCEVFEMSDTEGISVHKGPLLQGHCGHGVRGVAAHPRQAEVFCTVGADGTLRVWDTSKRKMTSMTGLDTPARCVTFNPDGNFLAIGLGGGLEQDVGDLPPGNGGAPQAASKSRKEGAFVILRSSDLSIVHEARDSKRMINAVQWSPDGGSLGAASEDGSVYLYNSGDWVAKARCSGFKAGVSSFDWSANSQFIQAVSLQSGELLFFDVERGEQVVPTNMADVQWDTQRSVFGWPVQGVWGGRLEGNVITVCERSNAGEQLVAADHFGRMRLYRYPCVVPEQNYHEVRGHAAPVRNVAFTADDSALISCGGMDCCVLQWAFEAEEEGTLIKVSEVPMSADDRAAHPELKGGRTLEQPAELESIQLDSIEASVRMVQIAGDEDFTPVKPWHRSVAAPSDPPPEDLKEPDNDLRLEWVHGCRVHDTRGNVMYSNSGELLFHAATFAVSMDLAKRSQKFYQEHSADVLSLAVHPTMSIAATGQVGSDPQVLIWNTDTMQTIKVLSGFHRRAVKHLQFSPDGSFLVTVGEDDMHSMAVYDWGNDSVAASARTGTRATLGVQFGLDGKCVIQCGDGFINFWGIQGHNMPCFPASLGTQGKKQLFLCLGWDGTAPVVGTYDGQLYRFLGTSLDTVVKAHDGEVLCMSSTTDGLATGGQDGYVKVWRHNLQLRLQVNMRQLGSVLPAVRSVCWDQPKDKILVATLASEIWEVNATSGESLQGEGKPVLQGHFHGELWGLSCHPSQPEYCTVGEDKMLRIWDIYSKKCIRSYELEMVSRAVAYSPDGSRLAIGYGMPVKESSKQFDGKWVVLAEDDFAPVHEARDSQKYITDIKWCKDGTLLAMGAFDNKIYVYNCASNYTLAAMITQHNSPITGLDFSDDGRYLKSTCAAYELFFFEADSGMVIPAASRLKNVQWATQTTLFSWPTQGVWPPQNDGTEVQSLDCTLDVDGPNKAVAAGDNFGRIRLYRYPATSSYGGAKGYRGHSRQVSRVRWASGHSHLLTTGAQDRCVLQWKHQRDDVGGTENERLRSMLASGEEGEEATMRDADGVGESLLERAQDPAGSVEGSKASRAWLAQMIQPAYAEELGNDPSAPAAGLHLVDAHGISQQGAHRGCVAYNRQGDIVYPTACLGVLYNKQSHTQRYYMGHSAQILCLAISPDGRFVATGEAGLRPVVRIWDSASCMEMGVLEGKHSQGISHVGFSPNGRMLVSVGMDPTHSLAIWRSCSGGWHDALHQALAEGDKQRVMFAQFSSPGSEFTLVSGGRNHVKFWTLQGRCLTSCLGIFAKVGKIQMMLCGSALAASQRFVTGAASGHLYIWKGRFLDRVVRAHQGCIHAVYACPVGVVSGGDDGLVKLWGQQLEHIKTYDLQEAPVPPLDPTVRSVFCITDASGGEVIKLLCATASSEMYEISRESAAMVLLQEGHHQGQLDGLATHPTDPDMYATAGDDCTIRLWSISLRCMLRKIKVDGPCRCLAWAPDGSRLLAGMGASSEQDKAKKDGAFLLIDPATMEVVFEGRDSRSWIRDCKYSPDGASFGLASTDHKIYMYEASSFALRATCKKHNSPVETLDYSLDSHYVQSNSLDREHLYFNATDGTTFNVQAQLKHVCWQTWTCTLGWPVQGLWATLVDGGAGDVLTLHRSHSQVLVASGTSDGQVMAHRYPVVSQQAYSTRAKGHAGQVACVRFTCDDKHVITLGREDRTVLVWSMT